MTVCLSCFRNVFPERDWGNVTYEVCQKCGESFMKTVQVDKEEFEAEEKRLEGKFSSDPNR